MTVWATSHMRPRARDHYTSSTLIGGKGGLGSSSLLHTVLEGLAEYVNAKDGCRIVTDSYVASSGVCFMVTWIVFKTTSLR